MLLGDDTLDRLRHAADPPADEVAALFLEEAPAALMRAVHAARYDDPEDVDPRLAPWFDDRTPLPAWADAERLRRGADFFDQWGVELGLGLFLCALPSSYAAAHGVRVLSLTGRLESDAKRRVFETAQFVLDVTRPGALEPGAAGYHACRHVRLMHAGVRQLILHDPRVTHSCADDAPEPRWCDDWGQPVNQEHLLGTMITFSYEMLGVLESLGCDVDASDADDYLHLWNVVGHLIGIDPTVLPLSRDDQAALEVSIMRRNFQASPAGAELTGALLSLVQSMVRLRPLRGLPASTTRWFIGDETADLLNVPKADWTMWFMHRLRPLASRLVMTGGHNRLVRAVSRRLSRSILQGFVGYENRAGGRPAFAIPSHLSAAWGVSVPAKGDSPKR